MNKKNLFYFVFIGLVVITSNLFGQISLPGSDPSSELETAGSLLKLVDTAIFTWGARLLAGIAVLSAGWSLKEQRFGMAAVCILAAIVIGTAPSWVKNIFSVGGGGIFTDNRIAHEVRHV